MGENNNYITPMIDKRDALDVSERLRLLLRDFTGIYDDTKAVENDSQAEALVNIYSNMMKSVIERLNRIPERNYIAFLNLLGINPSAPKAARAPIAFDLNAKSSSRTVLIPAKTQVAVDKPSDGLPLVFETENDQVIIRPDFKTIYCLDGMEDRYFELPDYFFNRNDSVPVTLFKANEYIKHRLFLGSAEAIGHGFSQDITIEIKLAETELKYLLDNGASVKWHGYFEGSEEPIELTIEMANRDFEKIEAGDRFYDDEVANLLASGYIKFETIHQPFKEQAISGYEVLPTEEKDTGEAKRDPFDFYDGLRQKKWTNFYISAELEGPITKLHIEYPDNYSGEKKLAFPVIEKVMITSKPQIDFEESPADAVFYNGLELDITQPFYPFGNSPVNNDAIYIGANEVLSQAGSRVTLIFERTEAGKTLHTIGTGEEDVSSPTTLVWEYYNGKEWLTLGISDTEGARDADEANGEFNFEDETTAFSFKMLDFSDLTGVVRFTCPGISPYEYKGKENYYVRVRILEGDYSYVQKDTESTYSVQKGTGAIESFTIRQDVKTYDTPMIAKLLVDFEGIKIEKMPRDVISYNNFFYKDHIRKNEDLQSQENLDENEKNKTNALTPFSPFEQYFTTTTTLYMAFDENIDDLPVNIFFSLANSDDEALELIAYKDKAGLILEYWNGEEWQPVHFYDETANMTQQGRIFFNSPEDLRSQVLFGVSACWIRLRYKKGSTQYFPKVDGIYLNPIWAHQAVSVYNEILGSSTGLKNQTFSFTNTPVLPGQQIYIQEKSITDEVRELILAEEGDEGIVERYNKTDKVDEIWVRWKEVDHFLFSTPNSRHYKIDRKKNTVIFGDGIKGMVPPLGRNNVKVVFYQYGGGERGNVGKGAINQLKTTIPFVTTAFNCISSYGGREIQTLEDIRRSGGDVIQFQKRTISVDDFDSMVNAYFKDIARIKTLPNTDIRANYSPGYITLMVLANSEEAKPLIKLRLIQELQEYIAEKSLNYLTSWRDSRINIITPKFIKMNVNARVEISEEADLEGKLNLVESEVVKRLTAFFHPVTGGQKQQGWELGEGIPLSEIISEIEQTEDVQGVIDVKLKPSMQLFSLFPLSDRYPLSPFPEQSRLKVGEHQQYLVARDISPTDADGNTTIISGLDALEAYRAGTDDKESLPDDWNPIVATGFKEEDEVTITYRKASDYIVSKDNPRGNIDTEDQMYLKISSVNGNVLTFDPVDVLRTFPVGSLIETRDKTVRSYLTKEIVENRNGALAFDMPLTVEVATPDKETTYNFYDNFNDDYYEDKWSSWFKPEEFKYIPFSKPFDIANEPLSKTDFKMINLENNLVLVIYKSSSESSGYSMMFGEVDKLEGTITFKGKRSINLGTGRRVLRSYVHKHWYRYTYWTWHVHYRWHHYGYGYSGNSRYGNYYGYRYAYRHRHYHYQYRYRWVRHWYWVTLPMTVGNFDVVKIRQNDNTDDWGAFLFIYTNSSDSNRAYSMVARYNKNSYYTRFYNRYDIIGKDVGKILTVSLEDNHLAMMYHDLAENNEKIFLGKIQKYHYHTSWSDYYKNLEYYRYYGWYDQWWRCFYGYRFKAVTPVLKLSRTPSDSTTGAKDINGVENRVIVYLRDNHFIIGFRGVVQDNEGQKVYMGYLLDMNWNEAVKASMEGGTVTISCPSLETVKESAGMRDFRIEPLYSLNPASPTPGEKPFAFVFVKEENGIDTGNAWLYYANEGLSETKNNEIGRFASESTTIKNLIVGGFCWSKSLTSAVGANTAVKPIFVIGFIDKNDLQKAKLVRCEIEANAANLYRMDFNSPVDVSDEKATDFTLEPFPKTNQKEVDGDEEVVYFLAQYRSGTRRRAVLCNETGLFGRPGPTETKYIQERHGYLSIDTGVAFENTPKRFYVISSLLQFKWQYFELSMKATIGDYLENNWSIFVSLTDQPISEKIKNAPPLSGLQLCVIRKRESGNLNNASGTDAADDPGATEDDTGAGGTPAEVGGTTNPGIGEQLVDDPSIVEKIYLFANEPTYAGDVDVTEKLDYTVTEILPDGTLTTDMLLNFTLRYYLAEDPDDYNTMKEYVYGKVSGYSGTSVVFEKELIFSKSLGEIQSELGRRSILSRVSRYHISAGVANLLDTDNSDPFSDDVDIRSRATVKLDHITSDLKIKPFENYGEDNFRLINRDDEGVYEDYEKGGGDFTVGINGIDHVYFHKHNLVYSGVHTITAVSPLSDSNSSEEQ